MRRPSASTIAVVLLLITGAFLRLYRLDHYPLPMHLDELSNAYDAYSIVETSSDRTGSKFPLVLRGTGPVDYRGALYAWLAAAPVAARGFSPAAARLPSAVLGILSLILVYLFARTLGGNAFALLTLAFASFSPWHITYSRLAHEGAMLAPFSLVLVLWLWQRAATRAYPTLEVFCAGVVLGLSTSGYSGMRLAAPLIGLLVLWDLLRHSGRAARTATAFIAGAILGAIPQLIVLTTAPEKFFSRFTATVSVSRTDTGLINSIADNIQYLINPRILFSPNMQESGYLAARLLPVEIFLYYAGLFVLHKVTKPVVPRFRYYVYWAFLLASIPALITWQSNSMRFSVILLLLPLWSAAGALWIAHLFRRRGVPTRACYAGLATAMAASVAFVGYMYLMSPLANGQRSTNVIVQLGQRLGQASQSFDRVIVVDSPYYAGLHVAAFSGLRPRDFQRTRIIEVDRDGWDYVREVGKYSFIKPHELAMARDQYAGRSARTLFVSRDAPRGSTPLDSLAWGPDRYVLWVDGGN